jgi:hypothetical protein
MRAARPLAAFIVLAAGCAAVPTGGLSPSDPPDSERLILVMAADPDMQRLDLRGARSGAYRQPRRYPGLPTHIVQAMRALATEHGLAPVEHWPMLSLGVQCFVFEAPAGAGLDEIVARLDADPRVESAQRMNRFELQSAAGRTQWDDPYRGLQRSLDVLDVAAAQRFSTGRGVRIAVIDTGIEASHPELAGRVAERRNFTGGEAGGDRHGTAVAGVIASAAGNRRGIFGIAPGARVLALKACEQLQAAGQGSCTTFDLARALDYAIGANADVLNLSLGGPRDVLLERLLRRAMTAGAVVVAAAGTGTSFPAALEGVIAVSGGGPSASPTAIVAPGVDVLSLAPPDGYDYFSGDSIAAAQVAGIVALLLEGASRPRASQVRALLVRSAGNSPAALQDIVPLVNACAALAELRPEVQC